MGVNIESSDRGHFTDLLLSFAGASEKTIRKRLSLAKTRLAIVNQPALQRSRSTNPKDSPNQN